MVLDDQRHEPVQEVFTLLLRDSIDLLDMSPNGKHALPSGHRIGTDDRMLRPELSPDILWGTTRPAIELEVVVLGALVESGLGVCGCQGFQEPLIWFGDAVEDFVSTGPQGVCHN